MLCALRGDRSELLLLGRRLIFGYGDISFDCHAVFVVPRLALADCAIKFELLMKGRVGGHILPVGTQVNRLFGATRQREQPKQ